MLHSDRPLGLLLIAGNHTHQENYARAFAADKRCRIVGLTDEPDVSLRRKSLNAQLAAELGVPLLADPVAALADPQVEIVSVCAEPERRARFTLAAIQAGKHVYVDKPLAASIADAVELAEAAAQTQLQTQMFSLIRSPLAQRARRVVNSGQLGELLGVHCELLFAKGRPDARVDGGLRAEKAQHDRFTWVDSKRELFCVGLYPLVLFPWLTGRVFESVTATTANLFFREHKNNDAEDFAAMLLTMSGGIQASMMVGRTGWQSHPSHGVHQLHLVGTEGTITLDAYRPRLEIFSGKDDWQLPPAPHPEDPMGFWSSTQSQNGMQPKTDWWPIPSSSQSDASYFLDCIEHDRPSDVSIAAGAHAVEAIFRGYESAASGKSVAIESTGPIMVAAQQRCAAPTNETDVSE